MGIDVYLSNGCFYVWSAADWLVLRNQFRIVGSFDGAEGEGWTKAVHANLPFKLSWYEARYLLMNGIICAWEWPGTCNDLDEGRYSQRKRTLDDGDVEEHRQKKRRLIEANFDNILKGRRQNEAEVGPAEREDIINQELSKSNGCHTETVRFDIGDPWLETAVKTPYILPELTDPLDQLRLRVFCDFHGKKYFLTSGLKFGGDFIAYKGDPLEHHAKFIIMCEDSKSPFTESFLISQIRLAHTLKKNLLVARFNGSQTEVEYSLLSRTNGNGNRSD